MSSTSVQPVDVNSLSHYLFERVRVIKKRSHHYGRCTGVAAAGPGNQPCILPWAPADQILYINVAGSARNAGNHRGFSGLFAARTLRDHGHQVQVFEKTGRLGARIATQTDSTYAFDTGAQYFTVRDDRLRRYVQSWQMDDIIQSELLPVGRNNTVI